MNPMKTKKRQRSLERKIACCIPRLLTDLSGTVSHRSRETPRWTGIVTEILHYKQQSKHSTESNLRLRNPQQPSKVEYCRIEFASMMGKADLLRQQVE